MSAFYVRIHGQDYSQVDVRTPGFKPQEADAAHVRMHRKAGNAVASGTLHRGGIFESMIATQTGWRPIHKRASDSLLRRVFVGPVGDPRYDNEQRIQERLRCSVAINPQPNQQKFPKVPHAELAAPVGFVSPKSLVIDRCWGHLSAPSGAFDWIKPGPMKSQRVRDDAIGRKIAEAEKSIQPLSAAQAIAARQGAEEFVADLMAEFPINAITGTQLQSVAKMMSNVVGDLARVDIDHQEQEKLEIDITNELARKLFPAPAQQPATITLINHIYASQGFNANSIPQDRLAIAHHAAGVFEQRLSQQGLNDPQSMLMQSRLAKTLIEFLTSAKPIPPDAYERALMAESQVTPAFMK